MSQPAPDTFKTRFETSQGDFVVEAHRDWAPRGVDRFHELVTTGFFDEARFFRVLKGFVVQFGIHRDPVTAAKWRNSKIDDDPVNNPNGRGTLTFATSGPNSRTTQLFVNLGDNRRLDGMGFAAFGEVIEGLEVVDKLHGGYGEGAPSGNGPEQGRIQAEGNAYLEREFPKLDFVKTATILTD